MGPEENRPVERADLARIVRALRKEMPRLKRSYAVDSLRVFGSYARGENEPGSDLDILVAFDEVPGLLKFVELEQDLSDMLGVKVDLVIESALKPRIGKRVLREAVPV